MECKRGEPVKGLSLHRGLADPSVGATVSTRHLRPVATRSTGRSRAPVDQSADTWRDEHAVKGKDFEKPQALCAVVSSLTVRRGAAAGRVSFLVRGDATG